MYTKLLVVIACLQLAFGIKYSPTWDSLDTRPLPTWFDESKLGVFMHWGVYAVPSFYSEWFWAYWKIFKTDEVVNFMKNNYPPSFTYADFAKDFTNEFFNANVIEEIVRASGARYYYNIYKYHNVYIFQILRCNK
jgi:alpha-L-fucosidase